MYNLIDMREVSIVQALAACELPGAFDGVQLRAVGWEVIEREASRVLLPPFPVQAGMMVFRVVGNDHDAASASGAGGPQLSARIQKRINLNRRRLRRGDESQRMTELARSAAGRRETLRRR